MSNLHLYPEVIVQGQDFSKQPVVVVPMQSMTLREIIKRFVRHESLPVQRQGFYEERLGDLEKLANEDITVQMDRVEQLKDYISKAEARMARLKSEEARLKSEEEKKAAVAASSGGGSGTPPISDPPGK